MKSVCFLLLLFVCNAIQAGNGAAKKEIEEEEAEEEEEESGSAPAQRSRAKKRATPNHMISVYSSLYGAMIVGKKELRVNLHKNQSVASLCHFFNSCKEKGALSRDPVQDAGYIEENYGKIKRALGKTSKSYLPSCDRIVMAINEVAERREAGDELLKPFLRENTKPKNQMISVYSSLYGAMIVGKKELRVNLRKNQNQSVASLCNFFNSRNASERLSGDPAQDAGYIKENYDAIKNTLRKTSKSCLPSCHRIVTAIQQVETRKEAGDELLKPFLSEKKDQMISMYSSLYWAIIKEEKELSVPLRKNQGLASLCNFFKSCKGPEMLSGDPVQHAVYIKENYDQIKSTLSKAHKSRLPSCHRIVTAIQQVETRKEAGDDLLKPFLGKKRVKRENINEEEAAEDEGGELLKPFLSEEEVKSENINEEEAFELPSRHVAPEKNIFFDEESSGKRSSEQDFLSKLLGW